MTTLREILDSGLTSFEIAERLCYIHVKVLDCMVLIKEKKIKVLQFMRRDYRYSTLPRLKFTDDDIKDYDNEELEELYQFTDYKASLVESASETKSRTDFVMKHILEVLNDKKTDFIVSMIIESFMITKNADGLKRMVKIKETHPEFLKIRPYNLIKYGLSLIMFLHDNGVQLNIKEIRKCANDNHKIIDWCDSLENSKKL